MIYSITFIYCIRIYDTRPVWRPDGLRQPENVTQRVRDKINQIKQITQTFKMEKEIHLNATFCQLMSAQHEIVLVLY